MSTTGSNYLQYNFGVVRHIKGLRVQGRDTHNAWCSAYKVVYNINGGWQAVQNADAGDMVCK